MRNVMADKSVIKQAFQSALFSNPALVELLTDIKTVPDSTENYKAQKDAFAKHCKSHLFIDDTLTEPGSFVFFDLEYPEIKDNTKLGRIMCFTISSRDILEDKVDGHMGNRADVLAELVESAILSPENIKDFGIGDIELEQVNIYNANNYYGSTLIFDIYDFR